MHLHEKVRIKKFNRPISGCFKPPNKVETEWIEKVNVKFEAKDSNPVLVILASQAKQSGSKYKQYWLEIP